MTLEAAIANLQSKALALSGMKAAPTDPPEASSVYPFAVSYENTGSLELESFGFANDRAVIFTEFHVSRQMLPLAIKTALSLRDPFLKAIMADPTLGGAVSTVVSPVLRAFGRLEWADTPTIGYRFMTTVKILLTST